LALANAARGTSRNTDANQYLSSTCCAHHPHPSSLPDRRCHFSKPSGIFILVYLMAKPNTNINILQSKAACRHRLPALKVLSTSLLDRGHLWTYAGQTGDAWKCTPARLRCCHRRYPQAPRFQVLRLPEWDGNNIKEVRLTIQLFANTEMGGCMLSTQDSRHPRCGLVLEGRRPRGIQVLDFDALVQPHRATG
jgi:hypothetical protein